MRLSVRFFIAMVSLVALTFVFASAATAFTLGSSSNLKVLALLVKYQDDTGTPAATATELKQVMFTGTQSVAAFYIENSRGKVGLTGIQASDGDVRGYVTMPENRPAVCQGLNDDERDMAREQAAIAGVRLEDYDRVVFVEPTCTSFGTSDAGSRWSYVGGILWNNWFVIAHEVGHGFRNGRAAQGHSNGAICSQDGVPSSTSPNCDVQTFGDATDMMGANGQGTLDSAFVRTSMGLLDQSNTRTVTGEGTFDIYATSEIPVANRTYNLQIPLTAEPRMRELDGSNHTLGGESSFLNLEYRQPYGQFDQNLDAQANVTSGASMRIARGYGETDSYGRVETFNVDADPHSRPDIGNYIARGLPWLQDFYYTNLDNNHDRFPAFDALGLDTGFYDPANDVLLHALTRSSTSIQIEYSKGLLAAQRDQVSISDRKLVVQAQPSYANDFYIRADAYGNIVVRDGNAPIAASNGCSNSAKNVVFCPISSIDQIVVNSGDRRDYVDVSVPLAHVSVDGGAGNDAIITGAEPDFVDGGTGNDTIITGAGNDVIQAGPGTDVVDAGDSDDMVIGLDSEADIVKCGLGNDQFESELIDQQPDGSCEPQGPVDTTITNGVASGGRSANTAPVFEFRATQSDATFQCSIDGGSTYVACSSPFSVATYSPGARSFMVRATSALGVVDSSPATWNFAITQGDVDGPVLTLSAPAGAVGSATPQVFFTASDPSGVASQTCKVDSGVAVPCVSGGSISASGGGTHLLTLVVADPFGQSTTVSQSFTVDVTPPVIAIATVPNTLASANPAFSFGVTEANTVRQIACSVDGGADFACAAFKPIGPLTNGTHTIVFKATDGAGNSGSLSQTFTVDTAAPHTTITAGPSNGDVLGNDWALFRFEGNDSADTERVECRLDGAIWFSCTPYRAGQFRWPKLTEGVHTFEVRAVDAVDAVDSTPASRTFTVDAVANAPTITDPASDRTWNGSPLPIGGTAEPGNTVKIMAVNDELARTTADASGNWSTTLGLTGAVWPLHAVATNLAGLTSTASATRTITVDNVPPDPPVFTNPSSNTTTGDSTPTISGTAESNSTVKVYFDGVLSGATAANATGAWSYTPSTALAAGPRDLTAFAYDAVGNRSNRSVILTITIDTTAPAVSISAPANGSTTTSTTPALSFSATDSSSHSEFCKIDTGSFAACAATLGPLSVGAHTVTLQSTDAGGNIGTIASTFTVLDAELRQIAQLSVPTTTESLTTQGTVDWSHWGTTAATTWDHKSTGGSKISNVTGVVVGGTATTATRLTTGVAPTVSWTDGTTGTGQTASTAGTATGITNTQSAVGRGFSLTVGSAKNTEAMTLRIHVGVLNSQGKLELFWASNPANIVSDTSLSTTSTTTPANAIYQVTMRPPVANDTLSVRWMQNTSPSSLTSKVRLYSASLTNIGLTRATAPTVANLSTDDAPAVVMDWAHWGGAVVPTAASLTPIGKSGATSISAIATNEGSGTLSQATSTVNPVATGFSWTGGDTTATGTNVKTGISNTGGALGRGFSFTVPADAATMRTLKLYVGVTNSSTTAAQPAQLELFWGSSTIPVAVDLVPSMTNTTINYVYTINLRHITAGTTLKAKWSTATTSTSHKATLQSAVLLQN